MSDVVAQPLAALELAEGARVRRSPFLRRMREHGIATASIYNRTFLPLNTRDPLADYWALHERVSVWDVACQRQIAVKGPDALAFADYLSARDLSGMRVGQARYVPICGHDGVLLNDPVTLRVAADEVWFSIADSDLLLWASAIAAERGFDVRAFDADVAVLAVQGPRATDTVAAFFGDWVRRLRPFGFRSVRHGGIDVVVCRSGWSHQGGFELFLRDPTAGERLFDAIWNAGEPHGIRVGGPNMIERLEGFLLSLWADTDGTLDPFEAGIGRYVALNTCRPFVGQQALRERHARGPAKQLVGLVLEGGEADPVTPNVVPLELRLPSDPASSIAKGGADAGTSSEGDLVGHVRSQAYSPRWKTNIATAIVRGPFAAQDTQLLARRSRESEDRRLCAVKPLPLVCRY